MSDGDEAVSVGSNGASHNAQLALLFCLSVPLAILAHAVGLLARLWRKTRALWERRLAFRIVAVHAAFVALLSAAGLHYVYRDRNDLPDLEPFIRFEPPTTGHVYDANGEVLLELAKEYRWIVHYPDLPAVVREAILAAEDKNFFRHSGIDYFALPRVLAKTVAHSVAATREASDRHGQWTAVLVFPQGGSTLTQQLVRGYFLQDLTSREGGSTLVRPTVVAHVMARLIGVPATNKLWRKIEEIRLALWLEKELAERFGSRRAAKEEILARYASFIYLGNGRYGFSAASEYYFAKPLGAYTIQDADKAALLAGITKSPRDYAPSAVNADRSLKRRNEILALMARNDFLSHELAAKCREAPIRLAARSPIKTHAPAVVENVFAELRRDGDGRFGLEQLAEGRIRVHSTVDNRAQLIVNEALENGLRLYEARHPESKGLIQGSVVVLSNGDGRILAETGGRQFYKQRYTSYSDYNRVLDSRRQPGSALKPVVYLAAFRKGSALNTRIPDAPIDVPMGANRPRKWISNYDGKFKGIIPMRQALAESRNAATIWVTKHVGVSQVLGTAREMGIRSKLQPYITTALGASEVSLLELANVYRAMASGLLAEPYIVDKVTDPAGQVLFRSRKTVRRLDTDETALRLIQEGLRGVVRLPSGTAHSLDSPQFPIPVMGKTGTTSDFRDALFVGSTYGPDGITVAARIGYDDNRELGDKETGGRTALPVFREIMLRIYQQNLLGPAPRFPEDIEEGIDEYLNDRLVADAAPLSAETVEPAAFVLPSRDLRLPVGALPVAVQPVAVPAVAIRPVAVVPPLLSPKQKAAFPAGADAPAPVSKTAPALVTTERRKDGAEPGPHHPEK